MNLAGYENRPEMSKFSKLRGSQNFEEGMNKGPLSVKGSGCLGLLLNKTHEVFNIFKLEGDRMKMRTYQRSIDNFDRQEFTRNDPRLRIEILTKGQSNAHCKNVTNTQKQKAKNPVSLKKLLEKNMNSSNEQTAKGNY